VKLSALADFKAHVLAEYPKEAVGVLINGRYVPCTNTHEEPTRHFRLSAEEQARLTATVGPITALLHSHPFDRRSAPRWPPEWPTHLDMVQWLQGTIPWGIAATEGENLTDVVWLDEEHPATLDGRPFVHGIWDCFSAVRDCLKASGLVIPNYPRGMEWWQKGLSHYEDHFQEAGFHEVPISDLRPMDCLLMKVVSPVINHAAVVTGPDTIFQHLIHRASGYYPLKPWLRLTVKAVRHGPKS